MKMGEENEGGWKNERDILLFKQQGPPSCPSPDPQRRGHRAVPCAGSKGWRTVVALGDSTAQLPDRHSHGVYVSITMSFYVSPSTYGLAILVLRLTPLSQPFSFSSLDPRFTEYRLSVWDINTAPLTNVHSGTHSINDFLLSAALFPMKISVQLLSRMDYVISHYVDFTHRNATVLCCPCRSVTGSIQPKKKKAK